MKYLGHAKIILGIDIIITFNKLFVSQELYLQKVLTIFSIFGTKIVNVSSGSYFKLSSTESKD